VPLPPFIAYLAPLFMLFELVQLVMSERLLGVKQIEHGTDPRTAGPKESIAAGWIIMLLFYWLWLGMMLDPYFGRAYIVAILATTLIGYAIRRNCQLKWILVILTFEGAIRIGMLGALSARIWRATH
jgi:hypothetical protein